MKKDQITHMPQYIVEDSLLGALTETLDKHKMSIVEDKYLSDDIPRVNPEDNEDMYDELNTKYRDTISFYGDTIKNTIYTEISKLASEMGKAFSNNIKIETNKKLNKKEGNK